LAVPVGMAQTARAAMNRFLITLSPGSFVNAWYLFCECVKFIDLHHAQFVLFQVFT
jgi:hypothetical protein